MKNIHILPTEKRSRFSLNSSGKYHLTNRLHTNSINFTNQNIYITSDEKIKEGVDQWYLDKVLNKPYNSGGAQYLSKQDVIILTTDTELIEDGVQTIDDEFLEWFVKNPSCEEVEVYDDENITDDGLNIYSTYKIIIPEEESKVDWYCPKCQSYVSSESVTFEEIHELCNTGVVIKEYEQETPTDLNKQTAVEWLEEQISLLHALTTIEISLFEQANQMHKEQIKESFVNAYLIAEDGLSYDFAKIIAEQYYNETYNVKDN